ncbi:MAG: hypothetical protein VX589_20015 [Myxococcota bacterium]|nr:hypothetical protein [Myxococcota bacterium]
MAETAMSVADQFGYLDDQLWRRLGVTETFERLLVEAAGVHPGVASEVAAYAARNLSGGAARFWDLSWEKIKRDLCRKRVLIESHENLGLHTEFAARLARIIEKQLSGVSHVAPTPGATVESIMEQAKAREEAEKRASQSKRRAATHSPGKTKPAAKPIKRSSSASEALGFVSTPVETKRSVSVGSGGDISPKTLFTSNRVNRLLDHLDNATLSTSQLGGRLKLSSAQTRHFLTVTNTLEITRVTRDELVELYWRGRELARTVDADRRMTVLALVKELRTAADDQKDVTPG